MILTTAAFKASTIGSGVLAGRNTPYHELISNGRYHNSSIVGNSDANGARVFDDTASARIFCAQTNGKSGPGGPKEMGMSPFIVSVATCETFRYAIPCICTCA